MEPDSLSFLTLINKVQSHCVIPENVHTPPPPPPTDGQWKFLRGGGGRLKGRNFRGVWGVPTRRIFHRVVKDAIDRTRHTLVYVDYFDL